MRKKVSIDWVTVITYLLLAIFGWMNIYSTSDKEGGGFASAFDFSTSHGRQMIFMALAFILCAFILLLDTKFIEFLSYGLYGSTLVLMVIAAIFAKETKGASAWFQIAGFGIQPTEFAKVGTLMALAKFMTRYNFSMKNSRDVMTAGAIAAAPLLLALLQNDAGSALTFFSLIFMFYREGLHPLFLVFVGLSGGVGVAAILIEPSLGAISLPVYILLVIFFFAAIALVSLYYFKWKFLNMHLLLVLYFSIIAISVPKVLKSYHKYRIRVLVTSEESTKKDKKEQLSQSPQQRKERDEMNKISYHLRQSLVAIGSGGVWGKGYGNATHTKGDFVPEEHTDYIFCVVGEEFGWIGSVLTLFCLFFLVWRVTWMAENSKSKYARVYGYGAASIMFFHILINVGMTIGLVPTIGIPLPFFSYGGSAMLGFSVMLFVLVNLHSYRVNILGDKAV